jgi:hypothetical protein
MPSPRFPPETAAFEVPSLADALELLEHLQSNWCAWTETGLDGTFVVVLVPERISEFKELLASVGGWITRQSVLALRFYLDGRVYIMQRGGFIGPADPTRQATIKPPPLPWRGRCAPPS